jgi:hypothetical protein
MAASEGVAIGMADPQTGANAAPRFSVLIIACPCALGLRRRRRSWSGSAADASVSSSRDARAPAASRYRHRRQERQTHRAQAKVTWRSRWAPPRASAAAHRLEVVSPCARRRSSRGPNRDLTSAPAVGSLRRSRRFRSSLSPRSRRCSRHERVETSSVHAGDERPRSRRRSHPRQSPRDLRRPRGREVCGASVAASSRWQQGGWFASKPREAPCLGNGPPDGRKVALVPAP